MKIQPLKIGTKTAKVPVIQGGMGVGISLGNLAGAVAKEGGIGIISAAQPGFREEDFIKDPLKANLRAIKSEYEKARKIASDGIIGFNLMVAMEHYEEYVHAVVEAGADLSRVMVIDDTEEALTLSDDRIEKAVRQNRVRLVIIDPVQAFIGADVDMNRANEVRPVFRKLGMIAEKTGCAIVLIGHLNKSSGTQSTYRGLGSIDIMAAVRSLIFIGKVRKDPTTRVLIHEKSSLAPPGETMAFKLGDEEGFRWVGAYEISADELLDGKEGKATETKLERGRKLIRELLADKKEISIRELDEKAKEQGISGRTMRDVRSRMKNELEYQVNEKQENSIRLKE